MAISTPQIRKISDIFIDIPPSIRGAMVRVQYFIMINEYLRLFPHYDEVQLLSIAILVRREQRETLGADCDFVGGRSTSRVDSGGFYDADYDVLSIY